MNIVPESWIYLYALLSESVEKEFFTYRAKNSWREDEEDFFDRLEQGISGLEFENIPASLYDFHDDLMSVYETVWDSAFNRVDVIPDNLFSCDEKRESLDALKQFAQRLQERLFTLHGRPFFLMNDVQRDRLLSECSSVIKIVDWALSYESLYKSLDWGSIGSIISAKNFNRKELHRIFSMLSCNEKEVFSIKINEESRNSIRDADLSSVLERIFHAMVDQEKMVFIPEEQMTMSKENLWATSYDEVTDQYRFEYPLSMDNCTIQPTPACAMSIYTFLVAMVTVMEPAPLYDVSGNGSRVFNEFWRKQWYRLFLDRIEWKEIRRSDKEDWLKLYRKENQTDYDSTWGQENSDRFLGKRKRFESKVTERLTHRSSTADIESPGFIESYINDGCPKEDYRLLISRVDNDKNGFPTRLDILKTTLLDLINDIRCITADRRFLESLYLSSEEAETIHKRALQSEDRIRESSICIYEYCIKGDDKDNIWSRLHFWAKNSNSHALSGHPPISKDSISSMIDDIIYYETEVKNYLRESISDEVFVVSLSQSPLTYHKEDDPIVGKKRLPLHELERKNIIKRSGSKMVLQRRKRADLSRVLAEEGFVDFGFDRYLEWKFNHNTFCELKQFELSDLREAARWDCCENLFYNPDDMENAIPASAIKKSFTERMDSLDIIQTLWKKLWEKNTKSFEANQKQ